MKGTKTLYYLLKYLLVGNSEYNSVDMHVHIICEDANNQVSYDKTDYLKDCILQDLKEILMDK